MGILNICCGGNTNRTIEQKFTSLYRIEFDCEGVYVFFFLFATFSSVLFLILLFFVLVPQEPESTASRPRGRPKGGAKKAPVSSVSTVLASLLRSKVNGHEGLLVQNKRGEREKAIKRLNSIATKLGTIL